jgi:anti-sigma factor RsiW
MTTKDDGFCAGGADRGEQIVAYLYDDLEAGDRQAFESHLASCSACRAEIAAFRNVRAELARWNPPEPAHFAAMRAEPPARRAAVWATLADIPVWAQTAAAFLCLGIAAGLANLDVRYGDEGLVVRTGWSFASRAETAPRSENVVAAGTEGAAVAPWQSDLSALEEMLRSELAAVRTASAPVAAVESPADLARIRTLIEESEQRQRRELALRLADVVRDVEFQRRDDLQKIDRSLGLMQANRGVMQTTGVEVMRQRQMLNDLAVRVSSQR